MMCDTVWDAVVIGGGPAGLAAGLQLARAGRRTLLLEAGRLGGQARLLPRIENFPGAGRWVSGRVLMARCAAQARSWGLEFRRVRVRRARRSRGLWRLDLSGGAGVSARAVVYCGGARFRDLGLPGERRLRGRGVFHASFAAPARFLRGTAVVVGGGEAAVHQAVALSKTAGRVFLLSRGALSAHGLLLRRLAACRNVVRLSGARVTGLEGARRLEAVAGVDAGDLPWRMSVSALFVLVGMEPGALPGLSPDGPGCFFAGDARGQRYRQVAVSAGDGLRQGMRCLRYLGAA